MKAIGYERVRVIAGLFLLLLIFSPILTRRTFGATVIDVTGVTVIDETWTEEPLPWQKPDSFLNYMVDWRTVLNLSALYRMELARARNHLLTWYGGYTKEQVENYMKNNVDEKILGWKGLGENPYERKAWLALAITDVNTTITLTHTPSKIHPAVIQLQNNNLRIPGVTVIVQDEIIENTIFPEKAGQIGATYSFIRNIGAHRTHGCLKSMEKMLGLSKSEALFLYLYMKYAQLRTGDGYIDSQDLGFVTGDPLKIGSYPSMRAFLEVNYSTPWIWPIPDKSYECASFSSESLDNIFPSRLAWREYYEKHPEEKDLSTEIIAKIEVGEPEKQSFQFYPLYGESHKEVLEVVRILFDYTEEHLFVGKVREGYPGKEKPTAPKPLNYHLIYQEWIEVNTGIVVRIDSIEEQSGLGSYEAWNEWVQYYGVYPDFGIGGTTSDISWALTGPLTIKIDLIDWGLGTTMKLDPEEGPADYEVKVNGTGFVADEDIELRWDSPEGEILKTIKADSTGYLETNIRIPKDARTGEHTVYAVSEGDTRATDTYDVMMSISNKLCIPQRENQPLQGIGATIWWDPFEKEKVIIKDMTKEDNLNKLRVPGPGAIIIEVPIDTLSFLLKPSE